MMKSLICLSLILLPLVSVVEGALGGGGRLGGSNPIKNVSAPEIEDIAKYAIKEHNKQSKVNLVFERVVKGTEQVVNGKKYVLTIAAKNGGGATKNYEAIVVERLYDRSNPRTLESFKAV